MSIDTFVKATNENAGYDYISMDDAEVEIVKTRDTIEDFMANQEHIETRKTSSGTTEVFLLPGSQELLVMDFGDYRLTLKD